MIYRFIAYMRTFEADFGGVQAATYLADWYRLRFQVFITPSFVSPTGGQAAFT